MLTELLTVLARESALSLSELARQTGYTLDETAAGLEQLGRMGYIGKQEFGQACRVCSRGSRCDTCPTAMTVEAFPEWHLTEKGRAYLAKRQKG